LAKLNLTSETVYILLFGRTDLSETRVGKSEMIQSWMH